MVDAFLCSRLEDQPIVAKLATILQRAGCSIWLSPGSHIRNNVVPDNIYKAMNDAACVLSFWSPHSRPSVSFLDQARSALNEGKLISILLDGGEPPPEFETAMTHNLSGWDGDENDPVLPRILSSISARRVAMPSAKGFIDIGNWRGPNPSTRVHFFDDAPTSVLSQDRQKVREADSIQKVARTPKPTHIPIVINMEGRICALPLAAADQGASPKNLEAMARFLSEEAKELASEPILQNVATFACAAFPKYADLIVDEPPRVCRRLQLLREWSHDQRIKIPEVLCRGA